MSNLFAIFILREILTEMKLFRSFLLSAFLLTASFGLQAQQNYGIAYQAVARDAGGDALENATLDVRFTLLDAASSSVWTETHSGVLTDEFGLINLTIGSVAGHHTKLWLDAFAMFIASIIGTYFARYAVKANFESKMLNDRTQGVDQVPDWFLTIFRMFGNWPSKWGEIWASTSSEWVYTPVWLPQIPMSIGTILLAIALWDNLTRLMIFRKTQIIGDTVA